MILVTEMQYFPVIYNYVDMVNVNNVHFSTDAVFRKSTFRNRMIIASSTGPIGLSIPIVGGRNCKRLFYEVEIDYKTDWQSLHLKSIYAAYGKAPWFSHYHDELKELYNKRISTLAAWNLSCIEWINKKLKIHDEIIFHSVKPTNECQILNRVDMYKPSNYTQLNIDSTIRYQQIFEIRTGFLVNLSVLDLLLNEGPNARNLLLNSRKTYSV
jgi:hypothetical protein